ncbi:hypothetical protein FNB15_04390 [Ferrovibrio terrae]|uniref:Flagellar hook-length control protein-like C-terminal domain-containing protein n=1 Tax=Ferrovibrio terrae TaxID=2594003 RepID=A0A516GYE0_9PROT|nr:flagellar hook-length control protein FliK [Ferrovibrio terrae]QDO96558.1 hypothetical protein FNB15_04390 [Ferrovibrio terrae]
MKVAQVNSPLASTHGQPAEEPSSRADAFARVLQTAVFGQGSEAVAKTTERAMAAAAPRTETRPVERRERAEPASTRPNTTPAPRKDTVRDTNTRDTAAAQKPSEGKAPARTETKPAKDTAEKPVAEQTEKAPEDAAATAPQQDAAAQPVDQTGEQTAEQPEAQDAAGDTAEETLPEDAGKPVVADAPDAALILALLQTQVVPVDAAAAVTTIAAPAADAAAVATVPVVSVLSPEEAAAAALAAAAEAQTKAAAPVQTHAADAEPVDAKAAAPAVAQPALPAGAAEPQIKTATDTSAAALLSQQQTVSAEDFATLQQALTAQNQGQVQVQEQAGKPAVTAEAKQKAEPKADKIVTVDVQTVMATPKTLVDQSALFAMQDDDQAVADMAQLQQQAQAALQQQAQPTASELKFNAALLQAAADDIALQAGSTASSSGTSGQQSATIGATTATQATQATQATHQAATQTAARHLNAYVPVGEQVGVQIKKGVAEGLDKISIKLDPGNLGKVEIKLEIGHDGRLQAVIAADKPETLQLLQQDVKNLEQSLRDAGLKTDQQSLNFTLRDQSQANEGRDGNDAGNGRHQNRGGEEYAETGANTDPAQLAAANAQRAATARGGLDIRI